MKYVIFVKKAKLTRISLVLLGPLKGKLWDLSGKLGDRQN